MWEKIQIRAKEICDILELIMAVIVGIGLIVTIVTFIPEFKELIIGGSKTGNFLLFLEEIFNIVVGIEFMKMICKPSSDNVIEVLVFLVARHMIIGTNSALDNLLSIASIGVLYLIKNYLHDRKGARALAREQSIDNNEKNDK